MKLKPLAASISLLMLAASQTAYAEEKASNKADTKKLENVTVVATDRDSSYLTDSKPTTNRSNVELEDISRSVQIFNEQIIEDIQPQSIEEIVTLSSNTAYSGDSNGRGETFKLRGFDAPVFRDGIRADFGFASPEIYDYERIEVVKGPDSMQFGQGNPGGIVNYVKKKPQKENHREIEIEYNTNLGYSVRADLGGS